MDDLLYWCRHSLSSHFLNDVCRQILVTSSHCPALQRTVDLRGDSLIVDSCLGRGGWYGRVWRWPLQVLDKPLQVVPGYARLDGHVMQMILKVPLLYDASLVRLKRVCESCLYPLEQGVVDGLGSRQISKRHDHVALSVRVELTPLSYGVE